MSSDPYTPPESPDEESRAVIEDCPSCGAKLTPGWAEGTLRWYSTDASALTRFVGGKRIAGPPPISISVGRSRKAAHVCNSCGLTLLFPG